MQKLTLVVLAAGLGSRYGGLKQLTPLGPNGEILIDYSLYDARKAGFSKVVFIVKRELRDTFDEIIGRRAARFMEVAYAFQGQNDRLPAGFVRPPERDKKPWGTAHALLCAENQVDSPFAVINADDFYGAESYRLLADFLRGKTGAEKVPEYALAGYILGNTLSKNGLVARGVCEADEAGYLTVINERTKIGWYGGQVKYQAEDESLVPADPDSLVSLNIWGFTPEIFSELSRLSEHFFSHIKDPLKSEFLLPEAVGEMVREGHARVRVLKTGSVWRGVTFKEDTEPVRAALAALHESGEYPALR